MKENAIHLVDWLNAEEAAKLEQLVAEIRQLDSKLLSLRAQRDRLLRRARQRRLLVS
jgi:hypothetical protein